MDQVIELLTALSSPDKAKRKPAEDMFQQGKVQPNPDLLLLSFLEALGAAQIDVALRTQAAVLLRQLVNKADKAFAFSKCSPENKQKISQQLLQLFQTEQNGNIRSKIGEVISRLADGACDPDDDKGYITPGQKGWPGAVQLTSEMGNCQKNQDEKSCCAALELLKDLVIPMKEVFVENQSHFSQLIEADLSSPSLRVKSCVFQFVCEMVGVLDKKNWAPLMVTVPVLNTVLVQLAEGNEQDELQECLQGYVEIAEVEPDFFKKTLADTLEPAKTLAGIVKMKEAPESLRNMALEFLVSYTEKKTKMACKEPTCFRTACN